MQIKKQIKYAIALLLIFLPTTALAASVTLRWQANQEADISSYNVYYGTKSRQYGQPIPAGNVTSHTVENLTEGSTYYFALTAVDTSGNESGFSSEVTANATSSQPATEDYRLLLSYNADRSNAVKLNGQSISGDVYIYLDPEAYVSQVVFSIDGQIHNTENYAPYDLDNSTGTYFDSSALSNGSHTISARIMLQDGGVHNISTTCSVSNSASGGTGSTTNPPQDDSNPLQAVTISTNSASTVTEGQSVVLRGTVLGGSSNTEYLFSYRYKEKTIWGKKWAKWNTLRDWNNSSSFTWNTFDTSGVCQIQINARNLGQTGWGVSDRLSLTILANRPDSVALSTNRTSPQQQGSNILLSANASGGIGSHEYYFMYRKISGFYKGKWTRLQDWSTSSEVSWNTAGLKGKYQLWVGVKNAGSESGVSAFNKINFQVY